jgi:hypothetical protein
MENKPKHFCSICSKKYSCRQNLYAHNKKFHPRHIPTFSTPLQQQNNIYVPSMQHLCNGNGVENMQQSPPKIKEHRCKFCEKLFSFSQSKYRHQQTCKKRIKLNEMDEFKKEIRKEVLDLISKQYKMHPKTFQKINNNINNGVIINNHVNIVALGEENIVEIMTEAQQKRILNYKFRSVFELIKEMHCGNKYPQFHNCAITNMRSPYAYKYDIDKKDFIVVNKNDLLDDILEHRRSDVGDMLELYKDDLDDRTNEKVQNLFDALDDKPNYENNYKKDITVMIYNEKHNIKDKALLAQNIN